MQETSATTATAIQSGARTERRMVSSAKELSTSSAAATSFTADMVMMKITPRQADVLDTIGEFIDAFGYGPSYRDIALQMHLSEERVRQHIDRLESLGLIAREVGTARSIRVIQQLP